MQRTASNRFNLKYVFQPWRDVDWFLLILIVGLTTFAGFMIRSTEINEGLTDWWQHWIIGGIGLVAAVFLSRWRYDHLARWYWLVYAVTNLALFAVMFIGTDALGAQRWITIAGFNVQPSEFAKLGVIITLAGILHEQTASSITAVIKALAITAVPWALVFLQPDLGTSLVFGIVVIGILYWSNANLGWIVLLVSPLPAAILFSFYFPGWIAWAILMGLIGWRTLPWSFFGAAGVTFVNLISGGLGQFFWSLLKDYQKERLILFLDPDKDPLGGGYHLIQSRIAIGAGELWGRGLNQGTQTQLSFIPEQHTDFIFSAIGEELGFVGCAITLLVFWLICLRLVIIAQNAKDNFGSILTIGVLSMIIFQVLVNIGMTIGLAPVTGIPLPWVSYGRSALLTNFLALGLVESVANHRNHSRY